LDYVVINDFGKILIWLLGTSTVKSTTPLPFIGLSERDSKLHTNFEIYEGKHHKFLKKKIGQQSQAIYVDKLNFKEKST
jgi:hypothetical protein